jgi:hypothetical protein
MSKTDLLLICQYWASPLVRQPKLGSEKYPLRFGSAFHKCAEIYLKGFGKKHPNIAAIAKKYDVEEKRLKHFYTRWRAYIDDLFTTRFTDNQLRFVEEKLAYNPYLDTVRFLPSKKERDYSERSLDEVPGTGDLILVPTNEEWFVVFDWKTGSSDYDAKLNGQLASLALGMSRHLKRYRAIVVILRIDEDFIEPYEAVLDMGLLNKHREKLRSAWSSARSANPSMRPGMHCSKLYCPLVEVCPTQQDPIAIGDEMHGLEPERKAFLFARFKAAEKMLEAVDDRFKREIAMNGPFQIDNGKWAVLKDQTRETISRASINRALGAVDGAALWEQLSAAGCVDTIEYKKIDYMPEASAKK